LFRNTTRSYITHLIIDEVTQTVFSVMVHLLVWSVLLTGDIRSSART